jgi:Tol biopolymer transport system component
VAGSPSDEPPPQVAPFNEEGAEFVASSWSHDGRRLAGYCRLADGTNAGIFLYNVDSREFTKLTEFGRNPEWLRDNRRILFFDSYKRKLYLIDSETRRVKELESPRSLGFPTLSPDNQHIVAVQFESEADIWLLTLDEES